MAIHKLSALSVSNEMRPGLHNDGGGLYLRVSDTGNRSWVFRYMLSGRRREAGLGSLAAIGLADARQKAADYRQQRAAGIDPIDRKHEDVKQKHLEAARALTFRQCAERYIAAFESTWKNAKHRAQWPSTLEAYVYPIIGELSIQAIDTGLVLKIIEPIWTTKIETAGRIRGRLEAVLDWAKAREYRAGENPARWRGHLENILPHRSKLRKIRPVKHHVALPYAGISAFMIELRQREAVAAAALEFLILTAARTSEVLGATWSEIDFATRAWTVPAARMKAGREHRVPLSAAAIAVLNRMKGRDSDFVFAGPKPGKPLSNMSLLVLLDRMDRADLTSHGFRSTFRTWTGERTSYPREIAEAALAHIVGDETEQAYQRGDFFDKRRRLMDQWAEFCRKPVVNANVLSLRAG